MTDPGRPGELHAAGRPAGVSRALDAAVARLWSSAGDAVVGAGFLIDSSYLMTCAHVVAAAVGRQDPSVAFETRDPVWVDFPLAAPNRRIRAKIEGWHPVEPDGSGDIAVLSFLDELPENVQPARLVESDEFWGHPFRAFGFPRRHDDGVWVSGMLRSAQGAGWVQMEGAASGYAVEGGFSGGAVWDDELAGVVGMTVAAESQNGVRAAYLIPAAALIDVWPGLAQRMVPISPFRGLYAFRSQDAAVFFGRDDLIERLVRDVSYRPFVAVVGPSGSGKSSVVFAGLLPQLQQRSDWVVVSIRPAQAPSPMLSLAGAVLDVLEPDLPEVERINTLHQLAALLTDGNLTDVIDRILLHYDATRLLLIVDQFEELFAKDRPSVLEFNKMLFSALREEESALGPRFTVLVTLRADFLNDALADPAMANALEDSVITIGQMGSEQLRSVIEGPLPPGVRFEPGLVDRILSDLNDEPGSLPLLEFALTLLWERQDQRTLTHAAYEQLGGVDGALASYAERVYNNQLLLEDRDDARRLFVQLARPSDVGTPVRRIARPAELGTQRWNLAQRLAATRLLVADRDPTGTESIELVHEALITRWARFSSWIEQDRAFRAWQEQLRNSLASWERVARDAGALLHGAALAQAERWLAERPDDLGEPERAYIRQGIALRGRSTRRLRIAVLTLALLLVTAISLGGVVAWLSNKTAVQADIAGSRVLANQAEAQGDTDPQTAMLLAASAYKMYPTIESTRALTSLGAEYRQLDQFPTLDVPPFQRFLFSPTDPNLAVVSGTDYVALWDLQTRSVRTMQKLDTRVKQITFLPDGQSVLIEQGDASSTSTLSLWALSTNIRLPLPRIKIAADEDVLEMRTSRDGTIVGICSDGSVRLWDLRTQRLLSQTPRFTTSDYASCGFGFSARNALIYVQGDDLIMWEAERGKEIARTPIPTPAIVPDELQGQFPSTVAVAPNGRVGFVVNHLGVATWWDIEKRSPLRTSAENLDNLDYAESIHFSADSRRAVFVAEGDSIVVVDVATRRQLGTYRGLATRQQGLSSLSADGDTISVQLGQKSIGLIKVGQRAALPASGQSVISSDNPEHVRTLTEDGAIVEYPFTTANDRFTNPISSVELPIRTWDMAELSPSGQAVAGRRTESQRRIDVFDLRPGRDRGPFPLPGEIANAEASGFDPKGHYLAAANTSHIFIWSLDTRSLRRQIPLGTNVNAESIAIGADGDWAAAVDSNGRALVWPPRSTEPRELVNEGASQINFSESGHLLAVATSGGTQLWNLDTMQQVGEPIVTANPVEAQPMFGPEDKYLMLPSTQDDQYRTEIWNVENRTLIAALPFRTILPLSDSHQFLAIGDSGTQLLPITANDALQTVCRVTANDSLSEAEWERFASGLDYVAACP